MKSSRSRRVTGRILALGFALSSGGFAMPVDAANQRCDVVISVANTLQANALQIALDHSSAPAGDFSRDGCVVTGAPPAFAEVSVDGHALDIAWINQASTFAAPAVFATCKYFTEDPSATLAASDFVPSVKDCTRGVPPVACTPTVSVTVANCTQVEPVCGNSITELGEACDEGAAGDASCTSRCTLTGGCTDLPLAGCRTGAPRRSKIKVRDNTKAAVNEKDQAQWDWKNGAATTAAELGDPVNDAPSYYWCVYDSQGLVFGARVRPGGTCNGNPCWKRLSPDKLEYLNKTGNTFGISQLRLTAGPVGKASIRVKAKSKVGNFVAPHGMPLAGPVVSQLLIAEGFESDCFETSFPV
ncbi:MAG TPA: hypothetical protein VFO62_07150, partial [Candidatus Binatia bacterium]|nr:hypothetical protein [Candidatus Binatia bacterium]